MLLNLKSSKKNLQNLISIIKLKRRIVVLWSRLHNFWQYLIIHYFIICYTVKIYKTGACYFFMSPCESRRGYNRCIVSCNYVSLWEMLRTYNIIGEDLQFLILSCLHELTILYLCSKYAYAWNLRWIIHWQT